MHAARRSLQRPGKHDITESESLIIGRQFGTVTDIETSPRGTLYVVSLTNDEIYEVLASADGHGRPRPG